MKFDPLKNASMVGFLVVDTETTGLPEEDPIHQPYELAYRIAHLRIDTPNPFLVCHPLREVWLSHDVPLHRVSTFTKESRNYARWTHEYKRHISPREAYVQMLKELSFPGSGTSRVYQVGANPAFDRQFIDAWQLQFKIKHGLRHRMFDTDVIAAVRLSLIEPIGLEQSVQMLYGKSKHKHEHEAGKDVDWAWQILRSEILDRAMVAGNHSALYVPEFQGP